MFNSMNLVAWRGRGCVSPVGGARTGANVARVGAIAAGVNYTNGAARVNNADHYSDATVHEGDEVAPAVSAVQYQVCIQDMLLIIIKDWFFSSTRARYLKEESDMWWIAGTCEGRLAGRGGQGPH